MGGESLDIVARLGKAVWYIYRWEDRLDIAAAIERDYWHWTTVVVVVVVVVIIDLFMGSPGKDHM